MTRRLLVVGFGPFPRVPRNPSETLARRLAAGPRWSRLAVETRCLILPTTYAALAERLEPALAERPDAVLLVGVAARAARVRVEARAANRASRLFPDASGRLPQRLCLDPSGPPARTSPAAPRALRAIRQRGVAAGASRDAGRYLCNASYYRALGAGVPALFLHVPVPPGPHRRGSGRRHATRGALARWVFAFEQAALGLLVQGVGTSSVRRSTESR